MSTWTEADVSDPSLWRDRRPALILMATVTVVVVAAILIAIMAVSARGAARTAAAQDDADAMLAAYTTAAAADGDLTEALEAAATEIEEEFAPLLEVLGHEHLSVLDARGLQVPTQKLRERLEREAERAPLAPLTPPTQLAEPVATAQSEEWTSALVAAYRRLPDDERSVARSTAAGTVTELERRAGTDAADLAAVTGALDAARAAVVQIVADAAERAPRMATEVGLAPEAAVRAVTEAGEALADAPTGQAAIDALRTLAQATERAAEAHAVEQAAREKEARKKAEREAAKAEREAAKARRDAEDAERRWGSSDWEDSWSDHIDLPWFP